MAPKQVLPLEGTGKRPVNCGGQAGGEGLSVDRLLLKLCSSLRISLPAGRGSKCATVTLCTGTSFWGWTHPKTETAPPRPNLHQPELDTRFLRTHIGRKGAKASLDTERPQRLPGLLGGPGETATTSEKRRGQLSCGAVGVNEKDAVTPPLTLAGEQTRRSLVLGLWPPAEPAHQL